ncbi:hypothetical protein PYW08_006556 [Mythimna loreyi]|uniref:Uncharacterized protein n=1 Tax=Mythimna loreyi TaxID=667449 RepID=A0ACC2QNA7_9NEOP|nr:hypothetical protein PYW08_006556 [Mythimna loreyi]
MYFNDLEKCFVDECIHLRSYLKTIAREGELPRTMNAVLQVLRNKELETIYPNIDIALRMCVSTAVSNCSGERSFSCLKRVKNYLRSTMTDKRLNSLAILNIESTLLMSLNYDDVIDNFAKQKCRRRNF